MFHVKHSAPQCLPHCPSGSTAAGAYAENAPPAHFLYAAAWNIPPLRLP